MKAQKGGFVVCMLNWRESVKCAAVVACALWMAVLSASAQEFHRSPITSAIAPASSAEPITMSAGDAKTNEMLVLPVGNESTVIPALPPALPNNVVGTRVSMADVDPALVKQIVLDYLSELENKKKDQEALKRKEQLEKGVEVDNNPPLTAAWENNLFFTSPNKDWRVHLGGRFQFQTVFWNQPAYLKGPAPQNGGIPASVKGDGVGTLDDGAFFRRVRFRADGTAYENVEFVTEVDFEQLNLVTFDHVWAGMKDIPFLGTVRVGQHKVPQGMEMMASDYHLAFLEDRSALFDAFWTLFAPGIFIANNFANNNVSFQTMFHRIQPLGFYTSDFGDGNYAETTRMTWTPYYKDDGRYLVHVGGSYQYRTGDLGRTIQPGATGNAYADSQAVVRFRSRPELRDATGVNIAGSGVLGGNTARFVDTGFLLGKNVQTISPEFLMNWGPFAIQAEAAVARVQDARSIYPSSAFNTPRGSPTFWGGYVETSYFITGENRSYDRRFGVFDRPKLNQNMYFVRGDDGCIHYGLGAWQIAYRCSYLDLNDNGINGGQLLQHSAGLNWYMNDNLKVQFMYNNANRNVISPATSGTVQGFGTLVQWYF